MSKWLKLVETLAPIVLASVPGADRAAPIIPVIIHAIGEAEQIKGASGADKKAHVLATVQDAVTAINSTTRKDLPLGAILAVACQGIDTTIAAVNLVHQAAASAASGGSTGADPLT